MIRPYNLRNQNKYRILNFQNKFQMIKRFSHSYYTITSKYHEQSAILPISVNLAVLRIAVVVRISKSGNRKNPRFLRFLKHEGSRLKLLSTFYFPFAKVNISSTCFATSSKTTSERHVSFIHCLFRVRQSQFFSLYGTHSTKISVYSWQKRKKTPYFQRSLQISSENTE